LLVLGLISGTARSQVYSFPLLYTNTLASASGGGSLLGISLGQNTTAQGGITFQMDGNSSQIQLTLSDGITSLNEDDTAFTSTYSLTQDLISSTLTISYANSTPWGGSFQDVIYLPSSAMRADATSTLQYVNFGGGSGRFGFGPGIVYGQYQSVVTISDGTATGVFYPTAAPEPGTLALSAIGGLAGLFVFRRR
jgi:hypothetical protein